ncbi:MAG: sodium:proline symporter [Spirochaetae bacterium HGW-Spirochaetae-1]|jgi:sodium/proline symporter|nr:MAG: sodium:proline symporter [Spirochaetae bacterium HGW-Spirochaetae-1]
MTIVITTFLIFLLAFILIGIASTYKSKKTTEDYLIASRNIHPVLASLSAAATNTSGYMFIGLIGFTYHYGLSSIWVTIGWICGDYIMWHLVYRKLRERSESLQTQTVPGFIGSTVKGIDSVIVTAAGLITLVLLAVYASAQLKAGSKALYVLFGWDYSTGAIIGSVIVLIYCIAGGIRASIWTDAAQAIVMIISMSILLGTAMGAVGGPLSLYNALLKIDPALVTLFPGNLKFGPGLYVLGWFAAGIGVVGQPHMQIRTMSIRSPRHIKRARRTYFAWYIPFSAAAVGVGLYSRVLLSDISMIHRLMLSWNIRADRLPANFDPELALPALSMHLLPSVFIGLILAGLFAATMSTADSQILSSGAALTQDIAPGMGASRFKTKAGTLIVTVFALGFSLSGPQSVFSLVTITWSALGAGLGPLIILRSLDRPVNRFVSLAMMASGITTVLLWRHVFHLSDHVYEILPAMAAGFLCYGTSLALQAWRGNKI